MNRAIGMKIINKLKGIGLSTSIPYFMAFLLSLVFWEISIHLLADREGGFSPMAFAFLPTFALVLSLFCGIMGKAWDRVVFYLLLFVLFILYTSQLIYHSIFDSFYSVSMIGMGGDAVTNFDVMVIAELKNRALGILLLFLPIFACGVTDFLFAKLLKKQLFCGKQAHIARAMGVLCVVPIWFLGVLVLRLGGTGPVSAYSVYRNSLSDTDTSASKIGVVATTYIEAKSYFFGAGNDGAENVLENAALNNTDNNTSGGLFEAAKATKTPKPTPTFTPTPTEIPREEAVSDGLEALTPTNTPTVTPTPTDAPPSYTHWCYDEIDFEKLAKIAPDKETEALCNYFAKVSPTNKNEYTGLFEGYNLIYICAEAFWTYAINEELTPTLYKMANNGIVLNNYYSSFKNVTINGEFALATSLWPDVSRSGVSNGTKAGSFCSTINNLMPFGLGNLFREQLGITSYGFHNYKGSYYGREETWPNLGYKTRFMSVKKGDGGMTFSARKITSDYEMMVQSVEDYIDEDVFHAYYMTYSGHGPYNGRDTDPGSYNSNAEKHIKRVREVLGDEIKDEQALYYIAAHVELDKALEHLVNRLEEEGKLEKTVFVMAADHYPYYLDNTDKNTRNVLAGRTIDGQTEKYKSTCIIYNAGLKEPIICDEYCCSVDVLPTILNLFNIKYDSRLIAGKDVFSDALHKATLYNKSFITDNVIYYAPKAKKTWQIDTSAYSTDDLDSYISTVSSIVEAEYAASLKIVSTDFYRFVWENSGLLKESN